MSRLIAPLAAAVTATAVLGGLLAACSNGHHHHCHDHTFALAAATVRPAPRPPINVRKAPATRAAPRPAAPRTPAPRTSAPRPSTSPSHFQDRHAAPVVTHVVHHHDDDWCD